MEDTEQAVGESSAAMNEAAESTARLLLFLRERDAPTEATTNSTDGEWPRTIPDAPAADASSANS